MKIRERQCSGHFNAGVQKAQHFAIVAEIPGVLQDEVILQVDGDILHLSVEKKKTKEQVLLTAEFRKYLLKCVKISPLCTLW